jgi:NADH-quinone oxidoreductase subunit N
VIAALVAQVGEWTAPVIDWHALAPELILVIGINLVLFIDLNIGEARKWAMASLTGFVFLAAFVPIVTLAVIGDDSRSMFDGRYVVDHYALILKAIFLLVGLRGGADEPERARRGRLLPGRVLRAHALQRARHGDDGVESATS